MKDEKITTPDLQEVVEDSQVIDSEDTTHQEDEVLETPKETTGSDEIEEVQEQEVESDYDKVWNSNEDKDISDFDEQPETEEVQPQLGSEEIQETETPVETEGVAITKPLKYKGKEISVSSEDEAIALMQKGLDYEFKMGRIKPFRKAIKIIDDNGLSEEDIQALADAKDGKSEALNYIADKYNLPLTKDSNEDDDLFSDNNETKKQDNYQPEVGISNENDIVDYFQNYSKSEPEKAGKVLNIYNDLEPAFQLEVTNNIQTFEAFLADINDGIFDKLYPEVIKAKAINPNINWLQAYAGIAQQILKPEVTKEPTESVKKKQVKQRKATKDNGNDYDSAWNDDSSFKEFEHEIFNI